MGEERLSALVLSGGGAGGAFQVGALNYLYEQGYKFDAIYGTSVGALNAAGLRWLGIEELTRRWYQVTEKNVLKRNWLSYIGFGEGLYSALQLNSMVDAVLRSDPKHPEIISYAVAMDILSGEIIYRESREPNYRAVLLGSAAVPLYMPPVGTFVDGGVRCHTPLKKAHDDGHKDIIVVACNELRDESRLRGARMPSWPYKSIKIGLAATEWLQREIFCDDIATLGLTANIKIIGPEKRIIDTFEFNPQKIAVAIAQGYNTARQQFS